MKKNIFLLSCFIGCLAFSNIANATELSFNDSNISIENLSAKNIQKDLKTSYPQIVRTLRVTNPLMYGGDVAYVQRVLKNIGYTLNVDSYYGNITADCIKKYQKSKRLVADGIVGPLTWTQLMQE